MVTWVEPPTGGLSPPAGGARLAVTVDDLRLELGRLPKVDLHRHLEGSLRLGTLLEIAAGEDLDLPRTPDTLRRLVTVMPDDPRTLESFLSKFEPLRSVYRTPEIIQRLVDEVIEDAAADCVRHLELRFTPAALAAARAFDLGEVMDWVIEASGRAAGRHGLSLALLASVNRHEPVEQAARVAQLAAERVGRGVVALDLAGNERLFPADRFQGVFAEARQAGLHVTVHAGEWTGPRSIRQALEDFAADRIGHGVRVIEDPALAALARERRTIFEICLTSNLQSGAVRDAAAHPLPRLIQAGLQVTLNSDDPGISGISLTDEYALAIEAMGLSQLSLRAMILAAAQASFLPPSERMALEAELKALLLGA